MKLSLIIPAHNEAKLLPDCLRYAMATGYPWHEIIVVDNASTDETSQVAYSIREPIKVVYERLKGPSYARQQGYLQATGDILCYVDADTQMPQRWPWRVAYRFRTGIDVVCVSGPVTYYDIPAYKNWLWTTLVFNPVAYVTYGITRHMVNGAHFAVRRSALERIGGVPLLDFYGDDSRLGERLREVGRVLFLRELTMSTSARRMQRGGWFRTAAVYAMNYLRPGFTRRHVDYR